MLSVDLRNHIVQCLCDTSESIYLTLLAIERMDEPSVVVSHLRQLCRNLAWKLYTLQGGIGLQCFALDLLQKIRSPSEELVMGKLPSLNVCRRALGSGRLRGAVSPML